MKCVEGSPNSLGYFGYSYYDRNREGLKALAIIGSNGVVSPSREAVQDESYVPLSRPLFIYVNRQSLRDSEALRKFLNYNLTHGQRLASLAGSIPLPARAYLLAKQKVYAEIPGTSFGGDLPVGLSIGETIGRSFDTIKKPAYR